MIIQQASPAHAPVLSSLHGACFDEPWDDKAMADLLAMPGTVGLIDGADEQTPEGFILVRIAADEVEIITIGVLPGSRRRGLAKMLLDEALQRSSRMGARKMFLDVAEDNTAALSFYEKAGFQLAGKRAGYYAREEKRVDALIYRLEIKTK